MSKPKTKPISTSDIARTMGVGGQDIIEQAKRASARFKSGQTAWAVMGDFVDEVNIISYDRRREQYMAAILESKHKGVILESDHPLYKKPGSIEYYEPDDLRTTVP